MKRLNLLLFLFTTLVVNSQEVIVPEDFEIKNTNISTAINTLFSQISTNEIDEKIIHSKHKELTISILKLLKDKSLNSSEEIQKKIINFYTINENKYNLFISYSQKTENNFSSLTKVVNLIVEKTKEGIKFSIPLNEKTKDWNKKTIGNITYYYRNQFNTKRAVNFDNKNTLIAEKLGQSPEKLDFYLCHNYQEILSFLGFQYDSQSFGNTRDGYGVASNTIFSVMHNEDFSHDMFHYYSGKVNTNRNWITEEGIAYLWGNAYYTNANGDMIEQNHLVKELKLHLKNNPKASLLNLFKNRPKIFNHVAPEISVRSVISGVICAEVEKQKGKAGLTKLITCGSKDLYKNYLKTIDELIGINEQNFNKKVAQLL